MTDIEFKQRFRLAALGCYLFLCLFDFFFRAHLDRLAPSGFRTTDGTSRK